MPKAKYILHASKVDRIAIVDRPAVPDAEILVFKRRKDVKIEKKIVGVGNLPMGERDRPWDSGAAESRVREWAGGMDKMDWKKYAKAFMYVDEPNAETIGAYKLQYADVIDGELKAIPRAIIAIVQVLAGGRGGVDIPEEEKKKVAKLCGRYYKAMEMEPPESMQEMMKIEKADEVEDAPDEAPGQQSISVEFNDDFAARVASSAVDSLEQSFWYAMYSEDGDKMATWKKMFVDFRGALKFALGLSKVEKQEAQKIPTEEVVANYSGAIKAVAISELFSFLRNTMCGLICGADSLVNPEEAVTKVVDEFEKMVLGLAGELIAEKRELPVVLDKEGRVISSARLAKLKEALEVLKDVIKDGENYLSRQETSKKSHKEEAEQMDEKMVKEFLEKFEKLSAAVEAITPRLAVIEGVMKEKGFILTEDEKKKAEEVFVEAEKKLADEKVEAEKKLAEKVEAEKKLSDVAEARLVKMEEGIARAIKLVDAIEKRFGKTALEGVAGAEGAKEDVFGKALRADKTGKK